MRIERIKVPRRKFVCQTSLGIIEFGHTRKSDKFWFQICHHLKKILSVAMTLLEEKIELM